MKRRKIIHALGIALLIICCVLITLSLVGTVAHAAGLVDNTVDAAKAYAKYPLENYQLDFYVDSSWDWLPWNWTDGIGKSIQYGLYAITNFIWTVSLYISNATGYVVQEAYKLDFISDTANAIGKNIQTLAGITPSGFSTQGFYVGFLLILILIMGIYVAYTGLIKRETTKAVHAVINFLVVFILSASFIAYAPNYVSKINDFSSDVSNAALTLGTKIVLPDSNSKGKDSVDLIRESLFAIQVKQPWLLLQYGESDMEKLGNDRAEAILSKSPDTDGREDAVKSEIEDKDNTNLSVKKTMSRLGMVVFLFLFNIGISIFVFLLTGMMIFSQVLFIIYAMFLPISFILSMIPTYESMGKKALTKLFNTIMMRAGITLIITIAFSVSTMFYAISAGYPFFMIAFLQIVTFAGIYFKLGDLMSMFSLQSSDTQQVGRRIMRRPYLFLNRGARRLERKLGRTVAAGAAGGALGAAIAGSKKADTGNATHARPNHNNVSGDTSSLGKRAGAKVGAVLDTKDRMKDKAQTIKQQVKDMPTQTKYALHSGANQLQENISDFKRGVVEEKSTRKSERADRQNQHRQTVAEKRLEMEQARQGGTTSKTENRKNPASVHERPVVTPVPAKPTQQHNEPTIKERPVSVTREQTPKIKEPVTRQEQLRTQAVRQSAAVPETMRANAKQAVTTEKVTRQTVWQTQVQQTQNRQTTNSKKSRKGIKK